MPNTMSASRDGVVNETCALGVIVTVSYYTRPLLRYCTSMSVKEYKTHPLPLFLLYPLICRLESFLSIRKGRRLLHLIHSVLGTLADVQIPVLMFEHLHLVLESELPQLSRTVTAAIRLRPIVLPGQVGD